MKPSRVVIPLVRASVQGPIGRIHRVRAPSNLEPAGPGRKHTRVAVRGHRAHIAEAVVDDQRDGQRKPVVVVRQRGRRQEAAVGRRSRQRRTWRDRVGRHSREPGPGAAAVSSHRPYDAWTVAIAYLTCRRRLGREALGGDAALRIFPKSAPLIRRPDPGCPESMPRGASDGAGSLAS